jgi:hypothetical protein
MMVNALRNILFQNPMQVIDFRKYFSLILCIMGFAFLVIFFVISKSLGRNSSLQKHSELIWTLPTGVNLLGYDWLNRTQLVYVCDDHGIIHVWSFNLLDRVSTMMTIPTEELMRAHVTNCHPDDWQMSPTRTQLLVKESSKEDSGAFVLGLFRSNLFRFPLSPVETELRWLPKDAGIAQFVTRKRHSEMRVFILSNNREITTVSLPIVLGFPTTFCRRDSSIFSARSYDNIVEVDHADVWPKAAELKRLYFNVPVSGIEESPSFSPDGEHLAWVEAFSSPLATYGGREHAIFVANLESNAIREIGRSINTDGISQLRWTPDGSALSYLSGRSIYLVHCNNQ